MKPPSKTPLIVLHYFGDLVDPRMDRTKLHPLENIIFITLCSILSGEDSWEGIALWGENKKHWLSSFLELNAGIPSADTFRRVFEKLDPKEFEACFISWARSISKEIQEEVIAIDGKSIRSRFNKAKSASILHYVHVWATEQHLMLSQSVVDGAPNEPTEVPELLKLLTLRGAIVTADANNCSGKITEAVKASQADYLLCIKGNRGEHHSDIIKTFAGTSVFEKEKTFKVSNKGHGREETREVFLANPSEWMLRRNLWKDLKQIVKIERTRTTVNGTSTETHYYITSLSSNAEKVEKAIRAHWKIENQLHWELDVLMKEDSSRIANKTSTSNLATIKRIALSMLQREPSKKSISLKRRQAGWNNDFLIQLLVAGIT